MTDTNKTTSDYNSLREEYKEKAGPLIEERKKRSAALKVAFIDDPEKQKTKIQDMHKKLNAEWLESNNELIQAYRDAVKQKNALRLEKIFLEIVDKAKAMNGARDIDEEQLKAIIMKTTEKKINKEHLLNKPNMTAKDKEGMQKSIDYLVEKKMDTSENLAKLDAIVYTQESIEIGGVKWARKDITAKPNKKTIFQHNDVTHFKRSEDMIKEQNELLAKQGMEIPLDSYYEKSMMALPGSYSKTNRYEGGNILALITNMSMDVYCGSDGALNSRDTYGFRRSASSYGKNNARYFIFDEDKGSLHRSIRDCALPIRPVLK